MKYKLEASASRVVIWTGTVGMFSPLAHDLAIVADALEGDASRDGDAWEANVNVRVASLRTEGVVRRGEIDTSVLSRRDRAQIERRVCGEVLPADGRITVRARGKGPRGDVSIGGLARNVDVPVTFDAAPDLDAAPARARGQFTISLRALGVDEVRGPMNLFRVADAVKITFDVTFQRAD